MHDFLVSAISVLIVLGIMVIVHEFGHFLAAKLCGVRVEQFSVGFPPRLFGIKIGETDYCLSALPLGGYVKMTGETLPGENLNSLKGPDGETIAQLARDPGALTSHPRWQRIIIGLAGPCANFVLALVVMTSFYMFHHEVPLFEDQPVTLDWVAPGSAAANAGLMPGDRIVSFDSQENPTWEQINLRTLLDLQSLNPTQSLPMTVLRNGQMVQLKLQLEARPKDETFTLEKAGFLPQVQPNPIQVKEVGDNTPASKAGIQAGDRFIAVDGHAFHGVQSLLPYLQAGKGAPVTLLIDRGGKQVTTVVQPSLSPSQDGSMAYHLGFEATKPPYRVDELPFFQAVNESGKFCRESSTLILEVLKRVLTHKMSVSTLSGPLGIAKQTGQAWEATKTSGWEYMIKLTVTISLNLGILNLLPFPILDGGMILFLLIESAIRRDVPMAIKERVYQVAFVIIIVFAVYIIFNDLSKMSMFSQIKT